MPQIHFNKGIPGIPDRLTATVIEEPYYLKINITKLVFKEGFNLAADLIIEIADKDTLKLAEYTAMHTTALHTLIIDKEFEFVINEFKFSIGETSVNKFDFILYYENVNI